MKKRIIIISMLALLVVLLVRLWLAPKQAEIGSEPQSPPIATTLPAASEKAQVAPVGVQTVPAPMVTGQDNLLTALAKAVAKPIHFYGLVIDETGRPIAGAVVNYSASNKLTDQGVGNTRAETISGADGQFEISERGMGIHIRVSKYGYHQIPRDDDPRSSARGFYNGDRPGKSDNLLPTASQPAVFMLRQMGEVIPLVQLTRRSVSVSKDGTPTEISLTTGRRASPGKGDLRVEAWTDDQAPNAKGRYDWRCRITVLGGGLAERKGRFAFEAPQDGYAQTVELGETADELRWLGDAEREFFVRLSDNRHARITFRMMARGEHFFVIESLINPAPGNRNLESGTPRGQ